MSILQIRNLQKTYGKGTKSVRALDDVTFSVEGGVFGLLGHNDAGKTSLMKVLATIVKPTSMSMNLLRFPPVQYIYLFARYGEVEGPLWAVNKIIFTSVGGALWIGIFFCCKKRIWQ